MGVDINIILEAYKNTSESNYWKSINELEQLTKLPREKIIREIQSSEIFASMHNTDGDVIYTTKEKFRRHQSFGKKLIGAFKNRIA